MLEDFNVAVSRLFACGQSVRETDADLLRDQFRLAEVSEASCPPDRRLKNWSKSSETNFTFFFTTSEALITSRL